jgi:hypothetical protein
MARRSAQAANWPQDWLGRTHFSTEGKMSCQRSFLADSVPPAQILPMSSLAKSPLSVMVVNHGTPAGCEPFVQALRKTFLGVESAQAYTASD